MAFPTVVDADTKNGTQTSNSTSWTLTYPTNLVSGDLILAFMATDGNPTTTWPTGWVREDDLASTSAVAIHVAKKLSDGTETGNFTVTISASEQGAWRVFRITDWGGNLGTGWASGDCDRTISATTTNANPDPANHNPADWDVEDTTWFAVCAVDTSRTISAYPLPDRNTADVSGGAGGATLGVCSDNLTQASLNPGTFTISTSDDAICLTIGVRPAAPAVVIPDIVMAPYVPA